MNYITRFLAAIKTALAYSHGRNGTLIRVPVLGLWLALNPWGNCFRPAVILKTYKITRNGRTLVRTADGSLVKDAHGKAQWQGGENAYTVQAASLTLRTRMGETTFYWYGRLTFGWNSEHVAKWYGVRHQPDCTQPYVVDCNLYDGWLGKHQAY